MSDQAQGPGWWVASDGKWYPPETHPAYRPPAPPPPPPPPPPPVSSLPAPPTPPPPAVRGAFTTAEKVAVGAALATVLGCFLPWAKVAFVTLDGTDAGDFPLFLIAGGLLTWTAVARKPVGVIVLSAILILLWFAEYASIQDEEPGAISVSIGAGLWMILAGAVTALVAGIISRRARG